MTRITAANDNTHADVIVVGAGLGGLVTATRLAQAGLRVIVCERGPSPGGRARTVTPSGSAGFAFNLGPHAVYVGGPAYASLRGLGLELRGGVPSGRGIVVADGHEHTLPSSPTTMLSSGVLGLRGKFELLRLFARLTRISTAPLARVSAASWLAREVDDEQVRRLLAAFLRLSTYCGELDTISAEAAVAQLQLATRGVSYLDGGWAQLVDGVLERALNAGVELRVDARVVAVGRSDAACWAVAVQPGAGVRYTLTAEHVIVAGSPTLADRLLGRWLGGPRFAAATQPIRAACLDLGVKGAWPGPPLRLDLDQPIYLSVHSEVAQLAPPGHSLVSLAWYRRACDAATPAATLRARLEACARRWLPDLDAAVVAEQFLPDMIVAHDRPQPGLDGLAGRAPATLRDGLWLVGDWVGDRGQLLDATLASAETVCAAIVANQAAVTRASRGVGL